MNVLSYSQFLQELQAVKGFEKGSEFVHGFAPFLAFCFIRLAGGWSVRLSLWDRKLNQKARPWAYLGIFLVWIIFLLVPRFLKDSISGNSSEAVVLTIPIVPIEPTLVPDTLLFNPSLKPILHEE